jgi:hypothetical protein
VTLGGTFIYDDTALIPGDARIQSPAKWGEIWTQQYFPGGVDNLYRPLVTQSLALQWWLHGDKPWAFHLVNILLHASASAAVAELARRLAGIRPAYLAGLLFAAHPVHVEVVAEIVNRCEEMCALFILAALILFLHRPLTMRRALAIGACALAAMLSKEQGMLLPFLLLALAWFTRFKPASPREKRSLQLLTLILCWSVAALIVLREEILPLRFDYETNMLDVSLQPLIRSSAPDRALMVFVLLGHYAQLLIAPVKLSIDYGMAVLGSVADRRDPYLYLGIATLAAGVAAFAWSMSRRQWASAFCLLAAALTYAMVSNAILIGTIFGERLIYLPSAFLLICASIPLARLPTPALATTLTLLLALAAVRSVSYASRWNDRYQFYATSFSEQPHSIRLCEDLATELESRGDLASAARVADDGTDIAPNYWNIWALAGKIAQEQGDLPKADAMYHRAFALQPTVPVQNKIKQLDAKMMNAR